MLETAQDPGGDQRGPLGGPNETTNGEGQNICHHDITLIVLI